MPEAPTQQVPSAYRTRAGAAVVTVVSDGYLNGSLELLSGLAPGEGEQLMAAAFRPPAPRIGINTFAVHTGGRLALIDTGAGPALPTSGRLPANLAAAGHDPAEVDTVLLTHLHIDHALGLLDATGGRAFPNAELWVDEVELAFWQDDAAEAAAPERMKQAFATARRSIAPYLDRLHTFRDGEEVFPGVAATALPGHTPGHSGFRLDGLLIWGDVTHVPEVQLARPEVGIAFDADPAQAIATRKRVLDMAATDRLRIAGMHLHFPGIGHIERRGAGYALVPESWWTGL